MSKLRRAIRYKRYKVKTGHNLKVVFTTSMGEQIEGDVFDCSNTGLKTLINKNDHLESLNEGDIVPAAKICWEGREVALGRLVVRRLSHDQARSEVAFSTVDIQVPVSGVLSKSLEIDFDKDEHFDDKELNIDRFSLAHFIENEYTNVDLFDRVREFSIYHREWLRSDRYAYQNVRHNSKGNRVQLTRQRKTGRSDYILFGSNDYLGLGAHPAVVEAARNALDVYGFGSTGSPVTTGQSSLHIELCKKLAKLHNKEAAILFNSGYTANIGIICSLTSTNDLIIADQLCHASIQDAMQMSRASSRFFKHNSIEHLRTILERERSNFNGCLIVTEGVFSMDGDVACLDKIYELAREFNARIMVDQAHCFGVLGPNGLGVCDKYNLLRETDVIMGTFSKICGGIGGFAVGSQELIDWLRSFSRAQIFTVSLPPSTVAAVSKSLDLLTENTNLIDQLRKNIKHFVKGLQQLGCTNLSEDHESAVIPVVVGDEAKMGAMYQSLLEDGIICTPVVYPAVGKKNCRFRFTMMATHTVSDIDYAIACFEKAMLKVGFKFSDKNNETNKEAHKKSA